MGSVFGVECFKDGIELGASLRKRERLVFLRSKGILLNRRKRVDKGKANGYNVEV